MKEEKRRPLPWAWIVFGMLAGGGVVVMVPQLLALIGVFLIVLKLPDLIAGLNAPKRLPPRAPERKPLPPPAPSAPRVPTMAERMEAVGLHLATSYDTPGDGYGLSVDSVKTSDGSTSWCPFAMRAPSWIGRLFYVSYDDLTLSRGKRSWTVMRPDECGSRHLYGLYEMVEVPSPVDPLERWCEPRRIATFCRTHLRFEDREAVSHALGALWQDCHDMTTLVQRLEGPEAKRALDEAKLAVIEGALADLDGRRGALQMERMRLQDELGLLKGPPGRDRFPEDPRRAAADASPDDRTHVLPAITDDP